MSAVTPLSTWSTRPLDDFFEIIGGGTPSKQEPRYWGGDIPWASIRDMHSEELSSSEYAITESGLQNSSTKIISAGEVIMASRVGLGKACILKQDTAINQDIRALIPRQPEKIDRRFCLYWLQSMSYMIREAGSGATVKGVKLPFIKSLPFPDIELQHQKRIVAVLDQAFAALDRAQTCIEKNLANADKLFESELNEIFHKESPEWDKHLLPGLCTHFGRGKSKHRPRNDPKLYGGNTPFIQTGDLSESRHFITHYWQTYSEAGLKQSKLWPKGTICIAIVGATIGETGILDFDACFPDSIIGLRPDSSKCDPEYIEFMLQAFKNDLKQEGKGSARDNINLGTFKTRQFPVPGLDLQRSVIRRLSRTYRAAAKLRDLYEAKLKKLVTLRRSILNAAFSGGIA